MSFVSHGFYWARLEMIGNGRRADFWKRLRGGLQEGVLGSLEMSRRVMVWMYRRFLWVSGFQVFTELCTVRKWYRRGGKITFSQS